MNASIYLNIIETYKNRQAEQTWVALGSNTLILCIKHSLLQHACKNHIPYLSFRIKFHSRQKQQPGGHLQQWSQYWTAHPELPLRQSRTESSRGPSSCKLTRRARPVQRWCTLSPSLHRTVIKTEQFISKQTNC